MSPSPALRPRRRFVRWTLRTDSIAAAASDGARAHPAVVLGDWLVVIHAGHQQSCTAPSFVQATQLKIASVRRSVAVASSGQTTSLLLPTLINIQRPIQFWRLRSVQNAEAYREVGLLCKHTTVTVHGCPKSKPTNSSDVVTLNNTSLYVYTVWKNVNTDIFHVWAYSRMRACYVSE